MIYKRFELHLYYVYCTCWQTAVGLHGNRQICDITHLLWSHDRPREEETQRQRRDSLTLDICQLSFMSRLHDSPSWLVLLGEPADCRPLWPSDSIRFAVGGGAVTLEDTLLGESVLSSVRMVGRKQNYKLKAYHHIQKHIYSQSKYNKFLTLKTESAGVQNLPMLLLLLVLGFCGMVGRAARVGFGPWGTALRRVAGSGLVSPREWVFSGEPGSDLRTEAVEDRFSEAAGLATDREKETGKLLFFFFSNRINWNWDKPRLNWSNNS